MSRLCWVSLMCSFPHCNFWFICSTLLLNDGMGTWIPMVSVASYGREMALRVSVVSVASWNKWDIQSPSDTLFDLLHSATRAHRNWPRRGGGFVLGTCLVFLAS